MRPSHLAAVLSCAFAVPATAQDAHPAGKHDPVRLKNLDNRQYRGEPKANTSSRDTRCRIVRRNGQDRRICGTPTTYAAPKKK